MLDITRLQLSEMADVSNATLADFENGKRIPHHRTLAAIRSTLEQAGAFIANDGNIGVNPASPEDDGTA